MRGYAVGVLRRAAVSTMSNLAEAHGRATHLDKARFVDFSRGSAFETLSMFILGEDIGYLTAEESGSFQLANRRILGQVTQLSKYLRQSGAR